MRRFWTVAVIAAVAVAAVTVLRVDPSTTDIHLDRNQAAVAWADGDPYVAQSDLVDSYGHPAPSPRSPAAILVQSATIPLNDAVAQWFAAIMSVTTLAGLFYLSGRIAGADQSAVAALFLIYVILRPGRLIWWNTTDLAIPLVVTAWAAMRKPQWAGWLLGAAAAIKLWPLFIASILIVRKDTRQAGVNAMIAAVAFTGVGLLIPGVSISGTVEAMRAASEYWGSAPGVWTVLAAAVFTAAAVSFPEWRFGATVVAALLLSPIAWVDYWLAVLPLVLMVIRAVRSAAAQSMPSSFADA